MKILQDGNIDSKATTNYNFVKAKPVLYLKPVVLGFFDSSYYVVLHERHEQAFSVINYIVFSP